MTTTAVDSEQLEAFRAGLTGRVLDPTDPGYDEARQVHNGLDRPEACADRALPHGERHR